MLKVKLREQLRYYNDYNSDFDINVGQEKILTDRDLKSYGVKNYLFQGHLILTEGELLMNYKESLIKFSSKHPDKAYVKDKNKYFIKHLIPDTIEYIPVEDIPKGTFELEKPKIVEKSRTLSTIKPEEVKTNDKTFEQHSTKPTIK